MKKREVDEIKQRHPAHPDQRACQRKLVSHYPKSIRPMKDPPPKVHRVHIAQDRPFRYLGWQFRLMSISAREDVSTVRAKHRPDDARIETTSAVIIDPYLATQRDHEDIVYRARQDQACYPELDNPPKS